MYVRAHANSPCAGRPVVVGGTLTIESGATLVVRSSKNEVRGSGERWPALTLAQAAMLAITARDMAGTFRTISPDGQVIGQSQCDSNNIIVRAIPSYTTTRVTVAGTVWFAVDVVCFVDATLSPPP